MPNRRQAIISADGGLPTHIPFGITRSQRISQTKLRKDICCNYIVYQLDVCGDFSAETCREHYNDVIMGGIASQIISRTIVYSTVYSDADERIHQSSASLAFVWGIHRWPVNYLHKWPVTRKMFPFDDVIMVQWVTELRDTLFVLFTILCNELYDYSLRADSRLAPSQWEKSLPSYVVSHWLGANLESILRLGSSHVKCIR